MKDFLEVIGISVIVVAMMIGAIFLLALGSAKYETAHPCIRSHVETQTKMPMYYQPGSDGGIAVPLGNIKQVQVTVCDERK